MLSVTHKPLLLHDLQPCPLSKSLSTPPSVSPLLTRTYVLIHISSTMRFWVRNGGQFWAFYWYKSLFYNGLCATDDIVSVGGTSDNQKTD